MYFSPTTVFIPQLNSWSHGDKINAVIASVAVLTLLGTLWQSKKNADDTVRRINREARIKLYVPVLAMMQAEWSKFDAKMLSRALPDLNTPFLEADENLALLRAKIQSYEFGVEEDLLGSQKVSKAIDVWFKNLNACIELFAKFQSENSRTALLDQNASPELRVKREMLLEDLIAKSGNLQKDLAAILDLVRDEIGIARKNFLQIFWGHIGGTKVRKRTKNGGK